MGLFASGTWKVSNGLGYCHHWIGMSSSPVACGFQCAYSSPEPGGARLQFLEAEPQEVTAVVSVYSLAKSMSSNRVFHSVFVPGK